MGYLKRFQLLSFLFLFALSSTQHSLADTQNYYLTNLLHKPAMYPLFFIFGTISSYLIQHVAQDILESEIAQPPEFKSDEAKPFDFNSSMLLIRVVLENAIKEWIEKQDLGFKQRDLLIEGFTAGLKVPLYNGFLQKINAISPDLGIPIFSFIKELIALLAEGPMMVNQSKSLNGPYSYAYNLGYPLAFGHNTTPTCGIYDRYCTRGPNNHEQQPGPQSSSNPDMFVMHSLHLLLEVVAIGMGTIYALFAYYLGTVPYKILQGHTGKQFFGLNAAASFFVAKALDIYFVDGKLNEQAKRLLGELIKYITPYFQQDLQDDLLLKSQDLQEAVNFGKDTNTLILKGALSAKELMKIQTPVARFVTQLLYGYKKKN